VDISDTLSIKLEAIRAYRTQFPPAKERMFPMLEGYNRLLGQSAGFEAGEIFFGTALVGVTDLVQTVAGRKPAPKTALTPGET
jgi:LmbE family N-acetylglucosaminyl deacetylase